MSDLLAIIVIGTAGSGKSTIAKALAHALHATYIDKDDVSEQFTGAMLTANGEDASSRDGSAYYTKEIRPLEYATLLQIGSSNLRLGQSVVFDAPFGAYFTDPEYLTQVQQMYQWPPDVCTAIVRVSASSETTRRRLLDRGIDRDSWKLEHWDEFWETLGSAEPQWRGTTIIDVANEENDEGEASVELVLDRIRHLTSHNS